MKVERLVKKKNKPILMHLSNPEIWKYFLFFFSKLL